MSGFSRTSVRRRAALAALLAVLATAGTLLAADGAIKVSVIAILASEQDDKVDPELRQIAAEMQRLNPRLTGFRMVKMSCKSVKVGARDTFALVADQVALVTVEGRDNEDRVVLKVAPPLMGEITYMTTCGKFLPIVTPYRTKEQDLLILAVRVQPCPGKK
jgi:hypothetical protein